MSLSRLLPAVAAFMLLALTTPLPAESVGTLLSAQGEVNLVTVAGERPATPGTTLEAGSRIEVGRDGEATVLLNTGEALLLPAGTTTTLSTPEEGRGILARGLANLWESVTAKLRDSEATHAALGTVGAIRGEDAQEVENFDYLPGEAERHGAEIEAIEEHYAAGVLGNREREILLAVTAEKYERYATAEEHYHNALTPAVRSLLPASAEETQVVAPDDADSRAVDPTENDILVLSMLIDLYAKNGLFERASALTELAG